MHSSSCARLGRHLTITILAILFVSGCGEGDGPESIAGTPAPALPGVLVDSPVSGVSWDAGSGLSGTTDAEGAFQYRTFENVTFSIGDIVLGTVPGAPVITAVELTRSSNPTDQPALNMLVFLQSIDADGDPSNGITISSEAQANASGIALDFNSADFAAQVAGVVAIIAPGNTVVDETDALNHFYNTYAEFGGTDTFVWDFPGYPPVGGGASFELVFADEFNEGTAPDPAKWNYETGYGPGDTGWGNNEWQLYTESPDNVRVEDGNLVISALCPTAPCGIRDGSITSGKINTLGKFNFRYGKIVARIKPPVGKAAWPAFWSLGANFPEIGWPRSGEIDFMEIHNFFSDENTTHFTMHWFDEVADSWIFDSQFLTTGENLGDDFHIFEADWNEDRIIGKIDGQTYFTRQIEPDTMEEFLEEFYLILNVAMGGTLGSGNEPPAGDETFPQTMLVDYVRVFQGSEGSGGGAGGVLANFDDIIPTISEFGGAAPAIEAGPEGGDGNALKITRDGGEVFAGVFLEVSGVPSAGGEQTISALVYSPTAGIPFVTKLEYEENVGSGDVQANETVVVGWQTLTWTYNLEAGNDYNRFVILPDLGTVGGGEVYYIDNVTLVSDDGGDGGGDGGGTGGGNAPTAAAPTPPVRDAADVVSLFSDAYADVTVDTWKTDWSITSFADVDIAGNATKEYTSLNFVGIETVAEQVDVTGMTHFHVDIWTPNTESLEIKLVDFGPNGAFDGAGAGDDTEGSIFLNSDSTPPAQGEWVSLDIPLADFEAAGLTSRANIAQLIFAAAPSGDVTLYVDNVYFYNGAAGGGTGGGDAPTTAAPTPTQDAANVISLFTDGYTNEYESVTWPTEWSVVDSVGDVTIEGGLVKEHLGVGFVGIEFPSLDVSGMTHFHIDVFTPDAIGLVIKIVDFGGDGFSGGPGAPGSNDSEGVLTFNADSTPALTTGSWVSLDIPLADFQANGLANLTDINQLVLDAIEDGTALYVDNVYFYNDGGSGGGELLTNGDMEAGQDPWIGQATVADDGGNAVLLGVVTSPDPNQPFLVNASQIVELTADETYTLTFRAKATQARSILAGLGLNEAPWTAVTETVPLTTDWQTFTYTITTTGIGIANSRVLFDMNAEAGDVSIDDVSLTLGSLLTNGDMEAGQDPWIGQATVVDDAGNAVLQGVVTSPDPNQPFLVNASQVVELTADQTYVLTFKGRATQARSMLAGLGLNEAPWTAATESVPLTTDWQTFTYTITTTGIGIANSRVLFDMNGEAGDVSIDDVALALPGSTGGGGGGGTGGGGDGTFVNGDFETGGLAGWTQTQVPDAVGSITADSSGQGGRTGTVARLVTAATAAQSNDLVISQEGLGAGTVATGDSIDVSFDLYGSLAGAGGVVFVEVIFLNGAGEDVGGRDFLNADPTPYAPNGTWTTYSGTVTAGTGANGVTGFDVSGGVVLSLKAACGPIDGCGVDASFDNVTFVIN